MEGAMRNKIGKQAGRLALAIGLLMALSGCVVYPAGGPGYYHHGCCWYR
jgi:hypothetical protein